MKYKVNIILLTDSLEDAQSVIDAANKVKDKSVIINADTDRQEVSTIQLEEHNHEQPTKPCVILSSWSGKDIV